jgi:hypothetical protein
VYELRFPEEEGGDRPPMAPAVPAQCTPLPLAYDGLDHQPNVPRQVGDGHQDLEPQGREESPSLPVPSAEEQEEASLLVRFYM